MSRGTVAGVIADTAAAGHGLAPAGAVAFDAGSRLLVIAPHPDDESIAAAGLMQDARAAGARVAVWLLTDGDNNPWPQRWMERRWRIDAAARRRWGARRRAESAAALQQLGLDPAATLRCFGWPDGGLTDRFVADPAGSTALLADALRRFAPTDLVLPAAADRHPDHGAAALLLTLAVGQTGLGMRTLAYRVHGGRLPEGTLLQYLPDAAWECKQRAIAQYVTQTALTSPRLRRMAGRQEAFGPDPFGSPWQDRGLAVRPATVRGRERLVCELGWSHPPLAGQRLLVVTVERGCPAVRVVAGPELAALAQRSGAGTRLTVPAADAGACQTFVKLEPLRRGPWIFDRYPWARLPAPAQTTAASHPN